MKFIARHLNLIGLLMLAAFGAAAAGLYFQTPNYASAEKAKAAAPAAVVSREPAERGEPHQGGCCAEKPVVAEPPPAATCPHLAAQAAVAPKESSCCPKPATP
jgi:hypothetical protein